MQRPASLYIDVPALRPGTVGACAFAFASLGVATALWLAKELWAFSTLRSFLR
jgi:hypothetical protein